MKPTRSTDEISAENARISAGFTGIDDDMKPWMVRKIARQAAKALRLSSGARDLLVDLLEPIGEPAWRSPSPRSYKSLIPLALEHGKTPRTIGRYIEEIIHAGFAFRTNKQARIHGGPNGNGLNFAPLAARLDHFAKLADQGREHVARHGDARAAYHACIRQLTQALDRARSVPALSESALEIERSLDRAKINHRIDASVKITVIERAREMLALLLSRIEGMLAPLDKASLEQRESDQSDTHDRHTEATAESSYPADTGSASVDKRSRPCGRVSHSKERADARHCLETKWAGDRERRQPGKIGPSIPDGMIHTGLSIASPAFVEAYQRAPEAGWAGMVRAAESRISHIQIAPQTWHEACARMGPDHAALAVIVIEAKLEMDAVKNPGAYLRSLGKRAMTGTLNITASVFGIAKQHTA